MQPTTIRSAVVFSLFAVLCTNTWAQCPYPSRFGPHDTIGASLTQTNAKVIEAIRLIEEGNVYRIHHPYDEATIWLPFGRVHDVESDPLLDLGGQVFNQGELTSYIGQVGSQIDALAHAGTVEFGYYNCIPQSDVEADMNGLIQTLGVENIRPLFTRAVLFDFVNHFEIAGIKAKGEIMPASYVITVTDLKRVRKSQRVKNPKEGDVVLIYVGWEAFFGDPSTNDFLADNPGLGLEAVQWLADKDIVAAGGDIFALAAAAGGVEVDRFPPGHPYAAFMYPSHQIMMAENGIHIMENLKLSELAAASLTAWTNRDDDDSDSDSDDNRRRRHPYEYAFILNPLQVNGLSGAPANALAVD